MVIFADAVTEPVTWAAVVLAFLTLAAQVLREYMAWKQAEQNRLDRVTTAAQHTHDIKGAVTAAAKPLADSLATVEKQTNGITERLEAKTAALAESSAVLEVTTEKLKKFDKDATVIKKAEEVIAKQKQATGDSGIIPTPPPNHNL